MVRRVYDAWNRGDWDAVFRDAHPDAELTTQRGPDAGTKRQRDEVQKFVDDYSSAFDNFAVEPEEFFPIGDQVVVFVTRRARPKGGDVDMVVRNGHLWRFRDGRILSMTSFPDPEAALQAAGSGD